MSISERELVLQEFIKKLSRLYSITRHLGHLNYFYGNSSKVTERYSGPFPADGTQEEKDEYVLINLNFFIGDALENIHGFYQVDFNLIIGALERNKTIFVPHKLNLLQILKEIEEISKHKEFGKQKKK